MFEDSRGDLWVTLGFGGLTRFDLDGRPESIRTAQGLSHESVRHIFEDAEGNLWLGTEGGGLTVLSSRYPTRRPAARQPWPAPRVLVEELWGDSRRLWERPAPSRLTALSAASEDDAPKLVLSAGTSLVEAHYTALNFGLRGHLRFQCRLRNLDPDWTDAGAKASVSYTNLPPGRYELQVRAASASGPWSEPCEACCSRQTALLADVGVLA